MLGSYTKSLSAFVNVRPCGTEAFYEITLKQSYHLLFDATFLLKSTQRR
jgi:hypothetical protein